MNKKEKHWETIANYNNLKEFHSRTWEAAIASTQPEKPWPQKGDKYWYGNSIAAIHCETFNPEDEVNKYRLSTGNCHRTKEAFIKERNRGILKGKILKMLKELNGDWVADYTDGTQEKWAIRYYKGELDLYCETIYQYTKHVAKSREIWQQIIFEFDDNEVAEALEVK